MAVHLPSLGSDSGPASPSMVSNDEYALRERSGKLASDPKMLTLSSFLQTKPAEEAGVENAAPQAVAADGSPAGTGGKAAAFKPGALKGLRLAGCSSVDRIITRLDKDKTAPLLFERGQSVPNFCNRHDESLLSAPAEEEAASRRLFGPNFGPAPAKVKTEFKDQMYRSTRRLLMDVQLASDERLEETKHQMRVKALDGTSTWFGRHKMKDVMKELGLGEKATPAFLTYKKDDRPAAGSRRPVPLGYHCGGFMVGKDVGSPGSQRPATVPA
eukprot:TRINITY_DN91681_c0_g1_i1.p1 TRINITY_DN91681_c0_g1~~TRINITY_DN91681_c0_g1_i1.p1  ORF type:complete len:292 (-),score=71.71 TRINITY_DN91681_c0_g1_i1:85-897(-)